MSVGDVCSVRAEFLFRSRIAISQYGDCVDRLNKVVGGPEVEEHLRICAEKLNLIEKARMLFEGHIAMHHC